MSRNFKVRAGDFVVGSTGTLHFSFSGRPTVLGLKSYGRFFNESISLDRVASVEILAQDNVGRSGSAILRGAVGDILLGPVGAVVGAISSSDRRQTEIMFRADFDDGRTLLASADFETFTCLKSAAFTNEKKQSFRTAVEHNEHCPPIVPQPNVFSDGTTTPVETTALEIKRQTVSPSTVPTFGRRTLEERISKITDDRTDLTPRSSQLALPWQGRADLTSILPALALAGSLFVALIVAPEFFEFFFLYAATFAVIFYFRKNMPRPRTIHINCTVAVALSAFAVFTVRLDDKAARDRGFINSSDKRAAEQAGYADAMSWHQRAHSPSSAQHAAPVPDGAATAERARYTKLRPDLETHEYWARRCQPYRDRVASLPPDSMDAGFAMLAIKVCTNYEGLERDNTASMREYFEKGNDGQRLAMPGSLTVSSGIAPH
jgi:hypothetical protein